MSELTQEGLDYFERAGDEGDKKYVAAIRDEIESLRCDAERYRYLRCGDKIDPNGYLELSQWNFVTQERNSGRLLFSAELDAAIDAAMNGANV